MPLADRVEYVHEPTDLQCGQAVLAMLTGEGTEVICRLLNNERETKLSDMFFALDYHGIKYNKTRFSADNKSQLPRYCILSLETPRCWHWSLYFDGVFYDPEHGVSDDFPISNRKYYYEIIK